MCAKVLNKSIDGKAEAAELYRESIAATLEGVTDLVNWHTFTVLFVKC